MITLYSEADFLKKAKNGDESAFEQLVSIYQKKIYTIAYRNTRSEQDALDICQEVFLRLYRSLPGFKGDCSFSTWVYRIATNICIDFSRKKKGKNTVPLYIQDEQTEEILLDLPDPADTPEQRLERAELREEIEKALLLLSDSHRQIIILRDIIGLSYFEISELLSTPEGTVKSRLARAREQLRKILLSMGTVSEASRLTEMKGGAAHD